jgi:hypothetical protein
LELNTSKPMPDANVRGSGTTTIKIVDVLLDNHVNGVEISTIGFTKYERDMLPHIDTELYGEPIEGRLTYSGGADYQVKTLGNTCVNGATKNVKDIQFFGNGDWMKSTKAMQAGTSVVIQVTTQQRNPDGSYVVAEALTTVPMVKIKEACTCKDNEGCSDCGKGRHLVPVEIS